MAVKWLFQKTSIQFPVPMSDGSELPVTQLQETQHWPLEALLCMCTETNTDIHTSTYIKINFKEKENSQAVVPKEAWGRIRFC